MRLRITNSRILILSSAVLILCCGSCYAWDNEELEVFDVVEDVNQNFYELLGIQQNATGSEIRKAFHRLSLRLHPDKNSAEDADIQFRKVAAVYDILKDSKKREYYNNVLVNGLPNWRSAIFYYRRVRKMGMIELGSILFVVITIGQYLVSWGAYLEKRYEYEQILKSKLHKKHKKNKKGKIDLPLLEDILQSIPTPSMWNTLPFQLPKWTYYSIVGIPGAIRGICELIEERKRLKKLEEEEALAEQEEEEPEPVPRGPRRRRPAFTPREKGDEASKTNHSKSETEVIYQVHEKPKISGGLWTDDDILELIKLVKKYPGGTTDRWEKIADSLCRSVAEVTHMAKKVKDEGLKPVEPTDEVPAPEEIPKKVKTRATEPTQVTSDWSQEQQKALEAALIKYPKTGTSDRWEKIASCIEGKTKEDCQVRYRHIVEILKKKNNQ